MPTIGCQGIPLAVQWLGLHAFTAEGPDSIPGWGTKIQQAMQRGQNISEAKFHLGN